IEMLYPIAVGALFGLVLTTAGCVVATQNFWLWGDSGLVVPVTRTQVVDLILILSMITHGAKQPIYLIVFENLVVCLAAVLSAFLSPTPPREVARLLMGAVVPIVSVANMFVRLVQESQS